MHIFDYRFLKDDLLPAQLVNLTSNIFSLRTMMNIRKDQNSAAFVELETMAKIESIKASNVIEGIISTDDRIREIVQEGSAPLNHTEAEIAGYRDALNEIHLHPTDYDFNERDIKRFHSMMMRLADPTSKGDYKTEDNVIAEKMSDGRRIVRFTPTCAADTPNEMQQLVLAYQEARDDDAINKLLLIPCVILDFLCIHPFRDGNGRLSRLMTLLLLYRNGFDAGKYVSFEGVINSNKREYYESLRLSSEGWNEGRPRYFPFLINFLLTLYSCYSDLDRRFASVSVKRMPKNARIEQAVLNAFTPLSKSEICHLLPDVSPTTVEAVLGKLVSQGVIRKIGAGRNTKYLRE